MYNRRPSLDRQSLAGAHRFFSIKLSSYPVDPARSSHPVIFLLRVLRASVVQSTQFVPPATRGLLGENEVVAHGQMDRIDRGPVMTAVSPGQNQPLVGRSGLDVTPNVCLSLLRAAAACWVVCAALVGTAPGESDESRLLEGLRQRGWNDTALEFLDRAERDPHTPPDFASRIGFERAVTLVAAAASGPDASQSDEMLDQAVASLERFAAANPDDPLASAALKKAAAVLTGRAGDLVELSPERARSLLERAEKMSEDVLQEAERRLGLLPKPTEAPLDTEARQARFAAPGRRGGGPVLGGPRGVRSGADLHARRGRARAGLRPGDRAVRLASRGLPEEARRAGGPFLPGPVPPGTGRVRPGPA